MKLGLLTAPFPETPLNVVADWSAANGFSMLEVCCWPAATGETRRYGGITHIDVDGLSEMQGKEIVADLDERGIEMSGLAYYPNPLAADREERQAVSEHIKKVISAAAMMDVPVVNTFIGADHMKTQAENWESAKALWHPIVDQPISLPSAQPCRDNRQSARA